MTDKKPGTGETKPANPSATDRARIEETPAEVMGLPPQTNQPAPDVKGGGKNLPPVVWPEGDNT